jgi:preprotein translocase subunit SecF
MLEVFHNSNFRLMWRTKWAFMAFSVLSMLVAIGAMTFRGFNYGIDFVGGTSVQLRYRDEPQVEQMRAALEAAQLGDLSIQRIGKVEDHEVLIRVERHDPGEVGETTEGGEISSRIIAALRSSGERASGAGDTVDLNMVAQSSLRDWLSGRVAASGDSSVADAFGPEAVAAAIIRKRNQIGGIFHSMAEVTSIPDLAPEAARLLEEGGRLGEFTLRGVDFVGPTAGKELRRNTTYAILGAVIGILAYIWLRFHKVAWSIAAIIALVHDVTIAAGAMALTGREVSLPVVAALLTILGFSINDTIVVFDRIRENLRLYREYDFEAVVNAALNQTLSRTALTSVTLFMAVMALLLYGGDKLNPLSFCLMIGVIFGSYSSIFVASALLVVIHHHIGSRYVKT